MKRLLVTIASYGLKNDQYLDRVLSEYRSMHYDTTIVVLSNMKKRLGDDVEVVVGCPEKNPWTLPFAHKAIFAERQDDYDLFLYSEDDMLVTERNIEAYLRASDVLPPTELAGFFQWEQYPDGRRYFPAVHGHFHWVPGSLRVTGAYTFAQFTNEHSACYLMTRWQLKKAIASGGFLVRPHEYKYDLLVTAATDPYTQCGFTRVLCVSHFEDFLVAHLPNRYAGTALGQDDSEVCRQIYALKNRRDPSEGESVLVEAETKLFHSKWSRDYYEPARRDLLRYFPAGVSNVLSIGCGWGATEGELVRAGCRVVGIPIDAVIATCAESRGVEIVHGDLASAAAKLSGERFDGVLVSGVLHLLPDPGEAVALAASLLGEDGILIATVPNASRLPDLLRRLRHPGRFANLGNYHLSGMHVISAGALAKLFHKNGLRVTGTAETLPENWRRTVALSGGMAAPLFSLEHVIVGRKRRSARPQANVQRHAG